MGDIDMSPPKPLSGPETRVLILALKERVQQLDDEIEAHINEIKTLMENCPHEYGAPQEIRLHTLLGTNVRFKQCIYCAHDELLGSEEQ